MNSRFPLSPASQQALRRLRSRRAQRGMAVFLVVLVMTMVAGIGVFSMHSASLVDRATGFHRQNVQSAAMVEFGARAAATWLGPRKDQVLEAKNGIDPVQQGGCNEALTAASPDTECWVIQTARLQEQFESSAPVPLTGALLGQLSPTLDTATVLRAEISTEVTQSFDANGIPPGASGTQTEVTFTTTARIFPTDATTLTSCQAAGRGAISQQKLRAHALITF